MADPDTPPITALRIERDALKRRCDELEDFLRALASISQNDALSLLERMRNGDELQPLLQLARSMQQSHEDKSSSARSLQQNVPEMESMEIAEIGAAQYASLHLLNDFAARKEILEPRVEVVPAMPEIFPTRYVVCGSRESSLSECLHRTGLARNVTAR